MGKTTHLKILMHYTPQRIIYQLPYLVVSKIKERGTQTNMFGNDSKARCTAVVWWEGLRDTDCLTGRKTQPYDMAAFFSHLPLSVSLK